MDSAWATSRLRYMDAGKIQHEDVDFDGLDVRSRSGEKLGEVEGFVYDAATSRPYYVVVDSGGWFSSRQFLLPIGHAALDSDAAALLTDVGRDAIGKYPPFDPDRFAGMGDQDVLAFEQRTIEACCPDEATTYIPADTSPYDQWTHYHQPEWWTARFQPASDLGGVTSRPLVHEERSRDREGERDRVVARRDVSPHFEGRAQPGDVLGIETGGETTAIGDTNEDENRRREGAEKAADED